MQDRYSFLAFGDTRRVAAVGRDKTTPNSYPERDLLSAVNGIP